MYHRKISGVNRETLHELERKSGSVGEKVDKEEDVVKATKMSMK